MPLILNTKFNPFTYDELVKPLRDYNEAYKEVEAAYSTLAEQTEAFRDVVNRNTNSGAYNMYKQYSEDLNKALEDFSHGMTGHNRAKLLELKRRYAGEITPINRAYTKREADIAAQKDMMKIDPYHVFFINASDLTIDDYLRNPDIDTLSRHHSGALLAKQTADIATSIKQRMQKGEWESLGIPYQYQRLVTAGYTIDEVLRTILDKEPGVLTNVVNSVMKSSGVQDWWGENYEESPLYKKLWSQAAQGLYSSVGGNTYETIKDEAGLTQFQYDLMDRNDARRELRDLQRGAIQNQQQLENAIGLSGVSYLNVSGKDAEYKRILDNLKAGNQGLKASIFGKDGKANPLTVYDEYTKVTQKVLTEKERKDIENQAIEEATKELEKNWPDSKKQAQRDTYVRILNTTIASKKSGLLKKAAQQKVLDKYGVSQVLTAEEYNALKEVGYKGERIDSINQLYDMVNNLSLEKTYYSTNMSNYTIPDQKIRSELANMSINDSFEGRVYKLNRDGTQGEAIKDIEDLNLLSDDNSTGKKITNIYYSAATPDKIIIQVGDGSGERYLVDPNVLGNEVYKFITASNEALKNESSTERAITITKGLSTMLNNYNPTKSTTSSKAE